MDFVVIDTEGKRQLREIAIINSQGQLIYEAFTAEHPDNYYKSNKKQPLKHIIGEFCNFTQDKILVFHNAEHDIKVLRRSFKQVNLPWRNFKNIQCTYLLAREYFPNFYSYSLEHLAQKLDLKVDRRYFNSRQAHTARYDAQFTYQLYLVIKNVMNKNMTVTINPFSSSRVDNPFQEHPDNTNIYHNQYKTLESIIDDIKCDKRNHQSQGAVVIGEPGTGKTHLIMRLARERLQHNRLLFIPCPNDAHTVKYHTYSCILESLNKKIPDTNFNQLEYLLAYSFVQIISTVQNPSQQILSIIEKTKNNPLALYELLGKEGSQNKRKNWDKIEQVTNIWWSNKYGTAGYAPEILKGIVKFCRYTKPHLKQLVKRWLAAEELEPEELDKIGLKGWTEETSKENFSLEAIALLGKLSLLSEPLIIVFDQLEMLGLEHNKDILFNFGESVKEIFTQVPNSLIILNLFPDRWRHFQQVFDGSIIDRISQQQVILETPTETEMKAILALKTKEAGATLESLFTETELQDIVTAQKSIRAVLNRAADYYRYKFKNIPIPARETANYDIIESNLSQSEIIDRLTKVEDQYQKIEQFLNKITQALAIFAPPTEDNIANVLASINTEEKHQNNNQIKHNNSAKATNLKPPQAQLSSSPFLEPETLESKVIKYIQARQQTLEKEYSEEEIILDEKDSGKLKDIIKIFSEITDLKTDILPSKRVLPPHIVISNKNICIGFLSSAKGSSFTSRIQNYNEFVAHDETIKFKLLRDVRSSIIKSNTVGAKEIAKLKNTKNGQFLEMNRENRITFELIYQLISDIYNQDLDINLDTELIPALKIIADYFQDYWLIESIK
ncbi:MAG: hypothetical protein Tsb0014_13340 [Pleurocapsa sp.]